MIQSISKTEGEKIQVVGNLPYNISTPLLFHLIANLECIHDMTFMVQKEVAARLTAQPGNKNYGRLSVMVGRVLHTATLFDVSPESFSPPPKIISSVIRMVPRIKPVSISNDGHFGLVVSQAFSQRRKTVKNALKNILTPAQFVMADVSPYVRAEELTIEEFANLAAMVPTDLTSL